MKKRQKACKEMLNSVHGSFEATLHTTVTADGGIVYYDLMLLANS